MVNIVVKLLIALCIPVVCLVATVQSAPPSLYGKATQQNSKFTFGNNERRAYPACQDGSGGMCVDKGTCPNNLKPGTNVPGACARGQECCFGASINDKTCGSRGGECTATARCGSGPKYLDAVDCDQKNGQICCIWTF